MHTLDSGQHLFCPIIPCCGCGYSCPRAAVTFVKQMSPDRCFHCVHVCVLLHVCALHALCVSACPLLFSLIKKQKQTLTYMNVETQKCAHIQHLSLTHDRSPWLTWTLCNIEHACSLAVFLFPLFFMVVDHVKPVSAANQHRVCPWQRDQSAYWNVNTRIIVSDVSDISIWVWYYFAVKEAQMFTHPTFLCVAHLLVPYWPTWIFLCGWPKCDPYEISILGPCPFITLYVSTDNVMNWTWNPWTFP